MVRIHPVTTNGHLFLANPIAGEDAVAAVAFLGEIPSQLVPREDGKRPGRGPKDVQGLPWVKHTHDSTTIVGFCCLICSMFVLLNVFLICLGVAK